MWITDHSRKRGTYNALSLPKTIITYPHSPKSIAIDIFPSSDGGLKSSRGIEKDVIGGLVVDVRMDVPYAALGCINDCCICEWLFEDIVIGDKAPNWLMGGGDGD
jgi:hypothetical protein